MLTPRLKTIYHHVTADKIADIGTDHAYIPIELILSGKIQQAIATDIKTGPLSIAAANIKKYGLSDQIELRLGSGLSPIHAGEVQEIIIAGMGGEMIKQILNADKKTAQSAALILQPMNAQYELRKWLQKNEYTIVQEDLALESYKIYNILIVHSGRVPPPEKDIFFHLPESLQNHRHFAAIWAKKHREFQKIRDGLLRSETKEEGLILKYTDLLKELERIKP